MNWITNLKKSFLLLFLLLIFACQEKKAKPPATTQEVESKILPKLAVGQVSSRATANGYYSYYIPKIYSGKEQFPVIIFLDPHADGTFPLQKYKSLAEKFGFLMIGSMESKNGITFDQSNEICAHLLAEAHSALPGNKSNICLSGFSGGAKAALIAGNLVKGFNGIIYSGAAIPPNNIDVNVPIIGFAGKKDMNFTEVKNFNFSLNGRGTSHILVEWEGKHEWPDSVTFSHAFYWLSLNEMKNNAATKNKELISDFETFIKKSISESDVLVKVFLLKEAILLLSSLSPVKEFEKNLGKIENSKAYQEAKRNYETTLFYEDKQKQEFAGSFDTRDLPWWTKQINDLKSTKTNLSNARILGYISLAAWTYSSKAVEANNVPFAKKALEIYKMADPENSEQPFLKACLYSKNNQPDSAIYFLDEAVKLGLKDKGKIQNEEKLINIRMRREFSELVEKIN